MNILHINDLHIKEPKGNAEALRAAYYPEYLEPLISKIKTEQDNIDYIFLTGDIVHKANMNNFPHAEKVLKYISRELSVSKGKIFIVNGNHDISRETGMLDDCNSFINSFHTDEEIIIGEGKRYKFYKIEDTLGVLCLDSIGSSYKAGFPSPLHFQDKDDIVTLAREAQLTDIFVLSHHPPESYGVQNQALFDESKKWSEKHMWSDGGHLHRRLAARATVKGNVFWFAGDIHRPEHCIIDSHKILIITGSLNSNENSTSSIFPQVRILSTTEIESSDLYNFSFEGQNRKGLEGKWERTKKPANSYDTEPNKKNPSAIIERQPNKLKSTKTNKGTPIINQNSNIALIDEELEKNIYEKVIKKRLYEFGRFATNSQTTSLSWVSIHGLLESYTTFLSIINAFKEKINFLIPHDVSLNDCLLVGVDSWGSMLASRLGAATNIRSCCVAVRSQRDSHDNVERVNDALQQIVKGKKIALVISDVIATGNSILTIRKELGCSECANWYNLTIFFDPSQDRTDRLNGYKGTHYICGAIKMPIIENSKLPDIDILKPNISFAK